ncbi:hypothetical protein GXP71_13295 [Cellulomonas sp. H30R-01]|uniref:hypothetical protein n=1 Tax=Cellulomonas sp. H30R-01 TaxID=2704467 RepID=UPI00138C658D|nr:hypothetical protein [Cellulomonas sp. H30R-01]QHT56956.1 hypothetical protein GXP71_13295 [Cellulomonas sp. H30R-01]
MRWLDAHASAHALADVVDARVAWLTGQSSWTHSALSPAQDAMLDALAVDGWTPVRVGFPWTDRAVAPYRAAPLVLASVRNAAQWSAARPGTAFTRETARHLQRLLDGTRRDLLLLCGSTGARMAAAAAPLVGVPDGLRVHVVGLGPVGALPRPGGGWTVHAVRGSADLLSRWGHRGPVDVTVPGGHLAAATSPAAIAAVTRLVGPPRGSGPQAPPTADIAVARPVGEPGRVRPSAFARRADARPRSTS